MIKLILAFLGYQTSTAHGELKGHTYLSKPAAES